MTPSDEGNSNVKAEQSEKPQVRDWKTKYVEDLGIEFLDLDIWDEMDEALLIANEEVYEHADARGFDAPDDKAALEAEAVFRDERQIRLAKMHLYGLLRIAKAIEDLRQQL